MVTNSGGGIALRLAARRPQVFRWLSRHEPALWDLLEENPESQEILKRGACGLEAVGRRIAEGNHQGAARQFADDVAFSPAAGEPAAARGEGNLRTERSHALDELQGPNPFNIDEEALSRLKVRLTDRADSPPIFPRVIDRLAELIPHVTRETIEGAAHLPQQQTPERYVEVTRRAVQQAAA